jgi:hypothetical protein
MNFEISNFEFQKFINDETALMRVLVCSSGDNLHSYPFTNETLKEAAERSLRGKPIVAKYNNFRDDFEGHSKLEIPIGYFVEHQEFEYQERADGTISLYAFAILWKNYAEKEYNVFVKQKDSGNEPIKGVSMEINANAWGEEGSWNGDTNKFEIKKFTFKGVTVLGDTYTPASPGAKAEMVSFTKLKNKTEKYFTENSDKITQQKDSHSYISKTCKELGLSAKNFVEKEDEEMPLTDEVKDEVVNAEAEVVNTAENFEDTSTSTDVAEKEEVVEDAVKCEAEDDEQAEDDKEIDNPDGESEKDEDEEDYKFKCGEMAKEIDALKLSNDTYMCEIKELQQYKFERENADKNFAIEEALNKVSKILPKDVIEEYRTKASEVAFEDAVAFCNEIKARVVDFADFKKEEATNRMSILSNNTNPNKKGRWEF